MMTEYLKSCRLFRECVEALNAEVFSTEKSIKLSDEFESMYPITNWGKIDWDKINIKAKLGYSPEKIIPTLKDLLGNSFENSAYIEWSDNAYPVIKTNLEKIIANIDDVTCVSMEIFIFNPLLGYIIEIRFSGEITVGLINKN